MGGLQYVRVFSQHLGFFITVGVEKGPVHVDYRAVLVGDGHRVVRKTEHPLELFGEYGRGLAAVTGVEKDHEGIYLSGEVPK